MLGRYLEWGNRHPGCFVAANVLAAVFATTQGWHLTAMMNAAGAAVWHFFPPDPQPQEDPTDE